MKQTMTNAEVKGLLDALNGLTAEKLQLSPRNWFTLTKNRKTLLAASQVVEDSRVEIAKRYADDEDKIPEEKMIDYQKEYLELLNIEVEVELVDVLLKDLEKDAPKLQGVPNLYLIMEYMVSDGERTPAKKKAKK